MDERVQAEHLDHYLDDLIVGAACEDGAVAADIAHLARRYLDLGRSAVPSGARERVLGRITPPHAPVSPNGVRTENEWTMPWAAPPILSPNGRHALPEPSRVPSSRPIRNGPRPVWIFAALLTVILLGGIAIRQGPTIMSRISSNALIAINAPTATGLAGADTLLEITAPSLLVPSGDSVRTCLSHITIPPHARSTWSAQDAPCCPGARLNYVLAGAYTIWPEGPVEVLRAGADPETMPAGSEITLQAGDAILLGSDTPFSADNPGETPTEILQQILASPPAFPRGTASLEGWIEHDYDMRDIPLQGGPMSMRLLRVTLEPQERLTQPPGVEFMQINLPRGPNDQGIYDVSASFKPPGSFVNISKEEVTLYVLALEPAGVSLMS